MKNELDIFTWDLRPSYYITHPWRWFRELFWNIRAAHNRIHKGYTDTDWMNYDVWFKRIAAQMLREMAMYSHGYPGSEPFDTPEKWSSWLHRMSDQLSKCADEDIGNEYCEPYINSLMSRNHGEENTDEERELHDKYIARFEELQIEKRKLFKETMDELIEHWDCLWD